MTERQKAADARLRARIERRMRDRVITPRLNTNIYYSGIAPSKQARREQVR